MRISGSLIASPCLLPGSVPAILNIYIKVMAMVNRKKKDSYCVKCADMLVCSHYSIKSETEGEGYVICSDRTGKRWWASYHDL